MLSLKSWSVICTLGTSALLGCTHSADLHPKNSTQRGVTLQSHHWQLQQAKTPQGFADNQWQVPAAPGSSAHTIGLRFMDNQLLSIDRLCNSSSGHYQTNGNQIQASRLVSTMMACSDASLMRLEQNVGQQLSKMRTWKISSNPTAILELAFEDGAIWKLKGTPTNETLYGSSERIFLEVAPQKMACSHPLVPNAQCMQVREVQYNEKGLKQSSSAWLPYYGSIEGYAHQAGVRNVLRIKRYTRPQTPADSSKYIDVLDMAVESEIVR
jgi:heat shock protein HslJ